MNDSENFQTFLSDEKLKKKLLNELKPVILADLLSMKVRNYTTYRYIYIYLKGHMQTYNQQDYN